MTRNKESARNYSQLEMSIHLTRSQQELTFTMVLTVNH